MRPAGLLSARPRAERFSRTLKEQLRWVRGQARRELMLSRQAT